MAAGNSRYSQLARLVYDRGDGKPVAYLERRFPPMPETIPLLGVATTSQASRLDLISARTQGDPLLAWRIADANSALNPFDLIEGQGHALRIPKPGR